jgi:hypothetical protein
MQPVAFWLHKLSRYYNVTTRRLNGPPDSDPFSVSRLFEETYPLVIPWVERLTSLCLPPVVEIDRGGDHNCD